MGISDEFLPFIPKELCEKAQSINQQSFKPEKLTCESFQNAAKNLLERYKNEAKLIITSALHCAAPCTAMGIPVILCRANDEQLTRFSALDKILPIYTLDDFKKKRVDFSFNAPNIEPLKRAMLDNLRLSLDESRGANIDLANLAKCKEIIRDFKV